MIVRELVTRLGFNADNDGARRHEKALKAVRVAALAAAAAAGAMAVGAAKIARETADAGREIARMSRLANAGTKEFQRMAVGAQSVGIENDKLSDILKDVNDKVGDFLATGGGPMADFFENIAPQVGVTAEQFRGLSGPQALQLYVDSLQKANLGQEEMTFYMEAIANDGTALLPILRDNGAAMDELADKAERYGAILSEDAIKQGEEFHKNLKSLGLIAQGLKFQLGQQLLPRINDTTAAFLEWYDANADVIGQGLDTAIAEVSAFLDRMWTVGNGVVDMIGMLAGQFNSLEEAAIPLAAAIATLLRYSKMFRWVFKGFAAFLVLDDVAAWVSGQESLIGRLLGSWENFALVWRLHISLFKANLSTSFQALRGVFEGLITYLRGAFTLDLGLMIDGIVQMWDGMVIAVNSSWDTLASVLNATWQTFIKPVLDKLGALDWIMDAWDALAGRITAAVERIGDAINAVKSAFNSLGEAHEATSGVRGGNSGGLSGQRAIGGNVSAGESYLVGERGPEPFFPSRSGYIATNRALQQMQNMASRTRDMLGSGYSMPMMGGGGHSSTTVTAEINMTVPPGTSTDQVAFIETNAQRVFNEMLDKTVRGAIRQYPRAE